MSALWFDNTQQLRIGVKGGGCSGMTYVLGFDNKTEKKQQFGNRRHSLHYGKKHGILFNGNGG